ncbi:MAG: tRNA-dihydrouridine synthase family protein [Spirochaetaceae bacterium]|nr:tRNA-dihydrouridine synthase family protein [Spirochaetaceae bacterium]
MVPLLLAPMAEISHRPLRELIESFGGCDGYFTEMISAAGLLGGGPFEKWYLDGGPAPERVVYQLMGGDTEQIVRAAALLDALPSAGIDLNMGCSAPAITRSGAGVRWMASLDRAGEMVSRVRAVTRRHLSVKLRAGLTDDFDYLAAFCRRLEDAGVERITLHPRTAGEKFRRRARWEYVGRLRAALSIPVAGNGDIATAAELAEKADGSRCDAVMTGRAAVKMPWIFAGAKRLPAAYSVNIEETGLRFLDLLERYQPPEFHRSRARRFFGWFCDNLVWGTYLKNLINRETSLRGMASLWRAYFRDHAV